MAQDLAANRAAILAAAPCFGGAHNTVSGWEQQPFRLQAEQTSWFRALAARCADDTQSARSAMERLLAASDGRLDIIRSTYPYDRTLADFATETYPSSPAALFWLGDASSASGDNNGAIQAYQKGLELDGTQGDIWLAVGNLYKTENNLPGAVRAYDQACKFGDTGSNGCERAGAIYLQTKQYVLAADRYRASIEQINYTWLPSEQGLASALLALGRTKEALPHLQILAQNGSLEAQQILKQLGAQIR